MIVGDPKQSQPVGAGGLWPRIEQLLDDQNARAELTHNLRAQDPADRRDQHLFRAGHHLEAVRGYADRRRVWTRATQHDTETQALRLAHQDRQAGNTTMVTAQTSNEHLDELNAQAQTLRLQGGEVGVDSLPVPGRPYELHAGDQVQIRHTIQHPDRGQLRNGTTATITHINPGEQTATIRLADQTELLLDREQLDQADVRLAYVQHPFPAQGATSDVAHLIVTDHMTREGAYVALTRARHASHIHAAWDQLTDDPDQEPIGRLAGVLSRSEPEIPSIATPLAHEQSITKQAAAEEQLSQPPVEQWRQALGPRPQHHPERERWDAAAAVITAYRERYQIDADDPVPLGPEPPAGSFNQRLDRRHAASTIADTLAERDRRDRERQLLGRSLSDRDRDLGWEP